MPSEDMYQGKEEQPVCPVITHKDGGIMDESAVFGVKCTRPYRLVICPTLQRLLFFVSRSIVICKLIY